MFALIQTGGKQYKVRVGMRISVEKLEKNVGDKVDIKEVLLVNDGSAVKVGTPLVSGAVVSATVIDHNRDKKVIIFKKSRRKNYRRKGGHKQPKTVLQIDGIVS